MRAYAKVNLALSVGPPVIKGRPGAGYHPIASWMHSIDLFDDLEVEPLPEGSRDHYDIRWTPSAPVPALIDWPLEQDYTFRAHKLLETHTHRRLPLSLTLIKRIPVGAGLGGGSANAAVALMLINSTFDLGLSMQDLARLSRSIGSDVAYFLDDPPARPALVSGIGDRIERLDRVEGSLILILPHFPCRTASVYAAYDRAPARPLREAEVRAAAQHSFVDPNSLFNDLEGAAIDTAPPLADLRRAAAEAAGGLRVHLTGSGSSLFIPCADDPEARRIARALAGALPGSPAIVRTRLM